MSEELIKTDSNSELDKAFDDLVVSNSYQTRVQLYGGNSKDVKKNLIGIGRFGIPRSKENIDDLGTEFNCIPLDFRYKALDTSGDDVVQTFDVDSKEFQEIKEKSFEKDSGCMFGVEFLLWMPEQSEFVTLYLSSKSSRPEAKPLRNLKGKAAHIKSDLAETKKYSWHVPVVSTSDVAISNLPSTEDVEKELARFRDTKSDETAEDTANDGR